MAMLVGAMAVLWLTGCGDDAAGTDNGVLQSTGEGPCEEPDECSGDVCVALIDGNNPPIYCTEQCTEGSCPSGFYCDTQTFGLAGLSFCRFGANDPQNPPDPPPEPPRLPCKEDADCEQGLVCATFMGATDCTLPCTMEDECTFSFSGITIDVMTCAADQTPGADRTACLPDLACYPDPQGSGCIRFATPGFP